MSLEAARAMALTIDRHCRTYGVDSMPRIPRMATMGPAPRARRKVARVRNVTPIAPTPTVKTTTLGGTMTPVIEITNAKKRYRLGKNNDVHALRGASLSIDSGEMVAIMGPSGSGKSTLMHILGCLDTPDSGEVRINGHRVDGLRSAELTKIRSAEVGFVFQGFNLVSTMTAIENVALAAEFSGVSRKEAAKRAEDMLELVGLGNRKRHAPAELSGGQQQRAAIARALVNRPKIILGDEPTGDLDTAASNEIVAMMRDINLKTGTTFVLVTHNPDVAKACDRTIRMRDGIVEDHGHQLVDEELQEVLAASR